MELEEIKELHVGRLDGAFYEATRDYLEKRGVLWQATRGEHNRLIYVDLTFPPGTKLRDISESGRERYSITLPNDSGFIYWFIKDGLNAILVPYFNLLNAGVLC